MKQSTHFYEAFACRDNGEEFFYYEDENMYKFDRRGI